MKDDELVLVTRFVTGAFLEMVKNLPCNDEDAISVLTGAYLETLAQHLGGVFPTVERLRNIADLAERQAFANLDAGPGLTPRA